MVTEGPVDKKIDEFLKEKVLEYQIPFFVQVDQCWRRVANQKLEAYLDTCCILRCVNYKRNYVRKRRKTSAGWSLHRTQRFTAFAIYSKLTTKSDSKIGKCKKYKHLLILQEALKFDAAEFYNVFFLVHGERLLKFHNVYFSTYKWNSKLDTHAGCFVFRVLWTICVMSAVIYFVAQVGQRTSDYFKYATNVDVKVIYANKLRFPAVTVCNQNNFR